MLEGGKDTSSAQMFPVIRSVGNGDIVSANADDRLTKCEIVGEGFLAGRTQASFSKVMNAKTVSLTSIKPGTANNAVTITFVSPGAPHGATTWVRAGNDITVTLRFQANAISADMSELVTTFAAAGAGITDTFTLDVDGGAAELAIAVAKTSFAGGTGTDVFKLSCFTPTATGVAEDELTLASATDTLIKVSVPQDLTVGSFVAGDQISFQVTSRTAKSNILFHTAS